MKENRYELVKYSEIDKKLLESTLLTYEEQEKINMLKENYKDRAFSSIILDLFKFNKNNYTTADLSEIFNVSIRQIQKIFKELGINRTKTEAQLISIANNDSGKLTKTYKSTLLENIAEKELSEDSLEVQLRHQLDLCLRDNLEKCEIIVGISSMNISNEGVNIPIIIIDNNYLYKYIIDIIIRSPVKAYISKKNAKKNSKIFYKGYTLFQLDIHGYFTSKADPASKYEKEIKNKIYKLVQDIKIEIDSAASSSKLQ